MPKYDFLIIGSGIMGLSLARTIKKQNPHAKILIIEKESDTAFHASGRNSGVLHAGFYYSADSLKAKFTVDGNRAMKHYCREKGLAVNECGKLVVAQNADEFGQLYELAQRGKRNGSNVSLISAEAAARIDPNVKTYKKALHSPDTASIDPKQVCFAIKRDLQEMGVTFQFQTKYIARHKEGIRSDKGDFAADKIINCAGLYADKIAHDFGFGRQYTIIPFKGLYLKYTKNTTDVKVNIYPVPNLKNPFLGVHFTKTADGGIKIGPTAIPAFWRENYQSFDNFSPGESLAIVYHEAKLFACNAFNFRDMAFEEMRKYSKKHLVGLAANMVQNIDPAGFSEFTRPGIRAQLLDKGTLSLLQDFVVEGDGRSTHILNAVSPAFTCAFPFAEFVAKNHLEIK